MLSSKSRSLLIPTIIAAVVSMTAGQALAAGAVTSSFAKGVLRLNGDASSNDISIVPGISGASFQVTPNGTTTLDGGGVSIVYTGVTRDIRIDLGAGDNVVTLTDLTINRNLFVTTDSGSDSLTLDNVVVGKTTKIDLGEGDNSLDMLDGFVGRGKIQGGQNVDTFMFDFSAPGTGFTGRIDLREGDDSLSITNLGGQNSIVAKGGSGVDAMTLDNVSADKLVVNAGKGDDSVTIGSLNIGKKAVIHGSADTDTLTDNGGHGGTGTLTIRGFELP